MDVTASAAAEHAIRDELVEHAPQRIIAAATVVIPRPILVAVTAWEARTVVPTVMLDFGADHDGCRWIGRGRNRRYRQGYGGDCTGDNRAGEYPARSSECDCREHRQILSSVRERIHHAPDLLMAPGSREEIDSARVRAPRSPGHIVRTSGVYGGVALPGVTRGPPAEPLVGGLSRCVAGFSPVCGGRRSHLPHGRMPARNPHSPALSCRPGSTGQGPPRRCCRPIFHPIHCSAFGK